MRTAGFSAIALTGERGLIDDAVYAALRGTVREDTGEGSWLLYNWVRGGSGERGKRWGGMLSVNKKHTWRGSRSAAARRRAATYLLGGIYQVYKFSGLSGNLGRD